MNIVGAPTDPWGLTPDEQTGLEDAVLPLSDPYDLTLALLVLLGVAPTGDLRRDIGFRVRDVIDTREHYRTWGATPEAAALAVILSELRRRGVVPEMTQAGTLYRIATEPTYARLGAALASLSQPASPK